MPFNRIYSTALWLLYVAGAPLLTAALALITIPLLLTEVRAGIILLLLPGVLTLAPLLGAMNAGSVPREAHVPAVFLGAIRVLVPAIIWAFWFSYFEGDAREGQALALGLVISAPASLVLWAWSVDQALTIAPYLDSSTPRPVVARRVEIEPALQQEERRAMLAERERTGRIARAISSMHPSRTSEGGGGVVAFPRPAEVSDGSVRPVSPKPSAPRRLRRKRSDDSQPVAAPQPEPSTNGATPPPDDERGDVFTGRRDR